MESTDNKNGHVEQSGESPVTQEQNANIDSDVATVISNIMNHSERVEEQVAMGPQQLPDLSGQGAPKGMVFVKANSHLKIQSLPILDNLVSRLQTLFPCQANGSVHPNSLPLSQVDLPRYHLLCVRTGFREWSGIRHDALIV